MAFARRRELGAIREVLSDLGIGSESHAAELRALLREGAGEEAVLRRLGEITHRQSTELLSGARDLLRIGVRPRLGRGRRRGGEGTCALCEKPVAFCWGCPCGFRICQDCLEENRWGITCNNITWECPDCGAMRSF